MTFISGLFCISRGTMPGIEKSPHIRAFILFHVKRGLYARFHVERLIYMMPVKNLLYFLIFFDFLSFLTRLTQLLKINV